MESYTTWQDTCVGPTRLWCQKTWQKYSMFRPVAQWRIATASRPGPIWSGMDLSKVWCYIRATYLCVLSFLGSLSQAGSRLVVFPIKNGKSEGFDSCDRPSNLTQIGFKSSIFQPVWPRKAIRHLFYATLSFLHHFVAIGEFKVELQSGNPQSGSNSTFLRAVWPWNLTDNQEKQ